MEKVKFYIKADKDSPIWGSAQDMKEWLANWHADGCPVRDRISLPATVRGHIVETCECEICSVMRRFQTTIFKPIEERIAKRVQ